MKEQIAKHVQLLDKDRIQEQGKLSDEELHKAILAELVPVAQEILQIILEAKLPMGDIQDDNQRPQEYLDAARKVQDLLIKSNLRWTDRHFVFQLAMQPIDLIRDVVLQSFERTFERKLSSIFGVSTFSELEMKQVHATFQEVDGALQELRAEHEGNS